LSRRYRIYFNLILILDFGKGLFNAKFDFDASEEFDNFKIPTLKQKEKIQIQIENIELKEIEIKNAMFDVVQEDIFFSLD
jgi:hypothetical protein